MAQIPETAVKPTAVVDDVPQVQAHVVVGQVAPGYARGYPNVYAPATAIPVSLWSTGVCSFMDDVNSAVESVFCIRCQLSRQYNVITYNSNKIEPWTFLGSLAIDILLGAPLTSVAFAWFLRNKIRARYQIAGDDCNDCLVSVFLPWCSAAQVYREMTLRGEWPSGSCIEQPFTVAMAPPVQEMDNSVVQQQV